MKKAIITGSNGFVGRNLIAHLLSKGYKILAIDCSDQNVNSFKNVTYIRSDLSQFHDCLIEEFFASDVMFHLAWTGVNSDDRFNISKQLKNIDISVNAIALAEKMRIKKVVFIGSTMEYCYNDNPICEASVPTPSNTYASVKTAVRLICQQLCMEKHIDFEYAVITSIYGKGREDNNVIFYCIKELLNGNTPKLTKCEQIWNFIHIDDAVRALKLIGEKGAAYSFYSLGEAQNRPLKEYINEICEIIDRNLHVEFGAIKYENGKIPNSAVDISKLSNDTGFVPSIHFKDGIKEVINYYRGKMV